VASPSAGKACYSWEDVAGVVNIDSLPSLPSVRSWYK
jgi:hypothetical protein